MKVGDRVKVISGWEYEARLVGETGMVKLLSEKAPDKAGIRFPGRANLRSASGVFWINKNNLEIIESEESRLFAALSETGLRVRQYTGVEDERAWNAGEIDILLAHPASCGYGLNLQFGGHHVIWFGLTWSLEQYEQANKRLHRNGQGRTVVIHHLLVKGGMDEVVRDALRDKGNMQNALMTALKVKIRDIGGDSHAKKGDRRSGSDSGSRDSGPARGDNQRRVRRPLPGCEAADEELPAAEDVLRQGVAGDPGGRFDFHDAQKDRVDDEPRRLYALGVPGHVPGGAYPG